MKFKYNLGDRVLFKKTTVVHSSDEPKSVTNEMIGEIEVIETATSKGGTKTTYHVLVAGSDNGFAIHDSDILGTVTVKRALAPRVRKKKVATQTQTEMLNGKTETKDTAWESEPSTTQ